MKKFVLSAGGTAGHVFPATALSLELRKNGIFTILITDKRGLKFVKNEFDQVIVLPISCFGLRFFLFSPWLFLKSFWVLWRSSMVISFGGYVSFFPLLVSLFSFRRFAIVQLDSIITRLHRLFLSFAWKIFYLFPKTAFFKLSSSCVLTGAPIRSNFDFSFIKHSQKNFVISVLGGSLGSDYWKDLLFNWASKLSPEIRASVSLFIQTSEDLSFLSSFNFKSLVSEPFFDTRLLFAKSHLIISRAGANTLAEIASVGRPAFLVPWLGALENHQFHNAVQLVEYGGCAMGDDSDLFSFFSFLYFDEKLFLKASAAMVSSFHLYGKERITKILLAS